MFTKQLVLSGFLLLSAMAPLSAVDTDMTIEDNSSDMNVGVIEPEGYDSVIESAVVDEELNLALAHEDVFIYRDSIATESEQQAPMKKKTTPLLEDMSLVQEPMVEMPSSEDSQSTEEMSGTHEPMVEMSKAEEYPSSEEMSVGHEPMVEMPTAEDYQFSVVEDKVDSEGQADVQGVFESMSREEEDESFLG